MAKKFTKLNLGDIVASVGGKAFRKLSAEEPTSNLISFTIDGTTYYAEPDMTWAEWVANKNYNTDGYYTSGSLVHNVSGATICTTIDYSFVKPTEKIADKGQYVHYSGGGSND